MTRATTLTWVDDLSATQADATLTDDYYDAVVQDVSAIAIFVEASLVAVTSGTSQYTLPSYAREILSVFYDDTELERTSKRELTDYNSVWSLESGSPVAYGIDDESKRTFVVYPVPDISSAAFAFPFGEPFGRDYPRYALSVVHTDVRVDYPKWMDLPIAASVLAQEFRRESNHKDVEVAALWKSTSELLLGMIFT